MPMKKFVDRLNRKFDTDEIKKTAKGAAAFAPGRKLDASFVVKKGSATYRPVQDYLDAIPGSVAESLRGIIHHALTSKPAKSITFTWSPAYDFEMNVSEFDCGITVNVKGRYPSDIVEED